MRIHWFESYVQWRADGCFEVPVLLRGPWWPGYLDGPPDPGIPLQEKERNLIPWFRAASGIEMEHCCAVPSNTAETLLSLGLCGGLQS